jgi:type VI secretion system secreted protein VgrG
LIWRTCVKYCPRGDQNREYLALRCRYQFHENAYASRDDAGVYYQIQVEAQPTSQPYRPSRKTPKPHTHGPQTAVVVGPEGEEIWTDRYGRIKVQFHWDRYGAHDENSSCWIRVSTPWAGPNFGAVSIPRIGMEVIVDHLQGDPDHPIVTGVVPNADQMPPWELPANATQSGILSRSTDKGGYDNANAIRFEDKRGHEQLWLHAEKGQLTEVENDEDKWVGNDRRKTVDSPG